MAEKPPSHTEKTMKETIHKGTGNGAQGGWHPTRGRGRHGRPRSVGTYASQHKSRRADHYPKYANGIRLDGKAIIA